MKMIGWFRVEGDDDDGKSDQSDRYHSDQTAWLKKTSGKKRVNGAQTSCRPRQSELLMTLGHN